MSNGNIATVRVSLIGQDGRVVCYSDMDFGDSPPDVHAAALKAVDGLTSLCAAAGSFVKAVYVVRSLTALARSANGKR